MSITIKINHDKAPFSSDGDVGSLFKLIHVPEGGLFKIERFKEEDKEISSSEESYEEYCYVHIYDNKNHWMYKEVIDGNMYVMENGKTISSFWGKKFPTEKALAESMKQGIVSHPKINE